MTRPNSIEIGGRDSRTTSSMAWRNDEPARSAFAISVTVSGSCLLNALSRDRLAVVEPEPRRHEPDEQPDEQDDRVLERRHDEADEEHHDRHADGQAGPDREVLGRLELEVGGAEVAQQVRAEVALLDDLVELGEGGRLRDELGDAAAGPALGLAGLRRPRRSARGARA